MNKPSHASIIWSLGILIFTLLYCCRFLMKKLKIEGLDGLKEALKCDTQKLVFEKLCSKSVQTTENEVKTDGKEDDDDVVEPKEEEEENNNKVSDVVLNEPKEEENTMTDKITKCESEEYSPNSFGKSSFEDVGASLMRAIENGQLDINDIDLNNQMLEGFRK